MTRPAAAHCDTADGEFTHYVERLHLDATTSAAHGTAAPTAEHKH